MHNSLLLVWLVSVLYCSIGSAMADHTRTQQINTRWQHISIVDGDSLRIDHHGQIIRVRLQGIDAPEKDQAFGEASSRNLSRCLSQAHRIQLDWQKKDRYGRILAKVWADQRDCNLMQIQQGYAWFYHAYQQDLAPIDRSQYRLAQQHSRHQRLGLWQASCPIAPWDWRRKIRHCCVITAKAASC